MPTEPFNDLQLRSLKHTYTDDNKHSELQEKKLSLLKWKEYYQLFDKISTA